MKKGALLLVMIFSLPLGACAALKSSLPPTTIYALHAGPLKQQKKTAAHIISIAEPEVPAGFDTERIALYLYGGQRMDYYANLAWPEHLGRVLQDVIVQSAASAPNLMAVTPESGIPASYNLFVKVNDFEPVYASGAENPPQLKVSMSFRLVSAQGEVLLNTTLSSEKPAGMNTQAAIIAGLEKLLQENAARAFREISHALAE